MGRFNVKRHPSVGRRHPWSRPPGAGPLEQAPWSRQGVTGPCRTSVPQRALRHALATCAYDMSESDVSGSQRHAICLRGAPHPSVSPLHACSPAHAHLPRAPHKHKIVFLLFAQDGSEKVCCADSQQMIAHACHARTRTRTRTRLVGALGALSDLGAMTARATRWRSTQRSIQTI